MIDISSKDTWPCTTCVVGSRALCASPRLRNLVSALRISTEVFPRGATVLHQGHFHDEIWVVLEGWVAVSELLSDGRKQVLAFALPGDLLGCITLSDEAPFMAEALTQIRLCRLPRRALAHLLDCEPALGRRALRLSELAQLNAFAHLSTNGRRNARERVAMLLMELFLRNGGRFDQKAPMTTPLTQSIMADALGLTPVHVNRMLGGLVREDLIQFSRGKLSILQPEMLAAAAGLGSEQDHPLELWTGSGMNPIEHARNTSAARVTRIS